MEAWSLLIVSIMNTGFLKFSLLPLFLFLFLNFSRGKRKASQKMQILWNVIWYWVKNTMFRDYLKQNFWTVLDILYSSKQEGKIMWQTFIQREIFQGYFQTPKIKLWIYYIWLYLCAVKHNSVTYELCMRISFFWSTWRVPRKINFACHCISSNCGMLTVASENEICA